MNGSHAFNTTNAQAFQEQLQDAHGPVEKEPHFVERALMIFGVGFPALNATEALKTVSMLSKALAGRLAIVASHGGFPLVTAACLPDNDFAGSSRRKLWWILTPVSASNTDRGFLRLETG